MKTPSRDSTPHSIFGTLRSIFYKKKVVRTARALLESFGDAAWLEAGRRQLVARTPAQIELWRDVATEIVLKVRASRDARVEAGRTVGV